MTIALKKESNFNIHADRSFRISLNINRTLANYVDDYLREKHLKTQTREFISLIINRSLLLTGKKETENLCNNSMVKTRNFNNYESNNSLFIDLNRLLSIIINGESEILKIMLNNLTNEIDIQHLFPLLTKTNRLFFLIEN